MKQLTWIKILALALVLSCSATACKKKNTPVTPLPGGGGGMSGSPGALDPGFSLPPQDSVGFGGGDLASFNPDDFNQDRAALAGQTVYFDYDSSAIRSDERPKLEVVAAALRADPSARLLIEGHCDERGTEEYNRSLGERRALAAREALALMGSDASRIATRSYGEDRPANPGHDESAWRDNRRAEFVLLYPR